MTEKPQACERNDAQDDHSCYRDYGHCFSVRGRNHFLSEAPAPAAFSICSRLVSRFAPS